MKNLKTIIFTACALFSLGAEPHNSAYHRAGRPWQLMQPSSVQRVILSQWQRKPANAKAEGRQQDAPRASAHGFGGRGGKTLLLPVDSLNKKGIAVIRFDFNGHGK